MSCTPGTLVNFELTVGSHTMTFNGVVVRTLDSDTVEVQMNNPGPLDGVSEFVMNFDDVSSGHSNWAVN